MAELSVTDPFAGLGLPIMAGRCRLDPCAPDTIISIAPFPGHVASVDAVLRGIGLGFPKPGTVAAAGSVRAVSAGRATAFLMGGPLPEGLQEHAALTDQGDGWAGLHLAGEAAEAVLARLVPLDLRPTTFPPAASARSLLNHMPCLLLRVTQTAFELYVFRSMAGTAVHELTEAMRSVAARSAVK